LIIKNYISKIINKKILLNHLNAANFGNNKKYHS
jgi:hypothetical protein